MKKMRNLHLWIGLICSVLILIESITGLLLSEPWLMGSSEGGEGGRPNFAQMAPADANASADQSQQNQAAARTFKMQGKGEGGNSLMGFIKGLHEGRIGGTDLKILADISAIAMIILTITGIFLSIRSLRSQRIRRQKMANTPIQ